LKVENEKLKNKSEHKFYINSSFFHLTIETEAQISTAGVFRRQKHTFFLLAFERYDKVFLVENNIVLSPPSHLLLTCFVLKRSQNSTRLVRKYTEKLCGNVYGDEKCLTA
jgi:hypothetical protein